MKKTNYCLLLCLCCTVSSMAQMAELELTPIGLGIGIDPQYPLHVAGDTYVAGDIYLGSSASNFLGTTSSNIPITFMVDNTLAGFTGSSANSNVSFGYGAINIYSTGTSNTAVGQYALYNNTSGSSNVAYGTSALNRNTFGSYNTANGIYALGGNISGHANTAVGYNALPCNNNGCANTTIGYLSLYSNTSGGANTAVGGYALNSNTSGGSNTAIGFYANVNAGGLNNATAIGYNAIVDASDKVRIGNSSVRRIGGYAHWTKVSDGRAKKNIRAEVPGLTFINQLQPVMYNFDLDALDELEKSEDPKINAFNDSIRNARSPEEKAIEAKSRAKKEAIVYSGFIAQDVEKAAQSVGYDFSGVDAPENGKGAYGLRYAEFVVPLVKAVQELNEQNNQLQAQIEELRKEVAELKNK